MQVEANFYVPNLRYHFKHKKIVQSDRSRVTLLTVLIIDKPYIYYIYINKPVSWADRR